MNFEPTAGIHVDRNSKIVWLQSELCSSSRSFKYNEILLFRAEEIILGKEYTSEQEDYNIK